ncbi:DUF1178 family protein [Aestuariibius sp. 2305UL40-4]|uniref:DUF1178 family protein n=1 Tax=Aestuariibius violaceus TaxID=3234132 RepID=UPI00345EA6F7
MIKYTLKCGDGHAFESWFHSSDAFDALRDAGRLSCIECGNTHVEKSLMAPKVRPGRASGPLPEPANTSDAPPPDFVKAVAKLKAHVEATSDYVADRFASEARAIHVGDAPDRPIYGEANSGEVKSLLDDGIPVAPLPFVSGRKVN